MIDTANHLLFRNPPLSIARNFYNLYQFQWILQCIFASEKLQCKSARLLTLLLKPRSRGAAGKLHRLETRGEKHCLGGRLSTLAKLCCVEIIYLSAVSQR